MKRLTGLLKFLPGLILFGVPWYVLTVLNGRRPHGIFEKVASIFTNGLGWFFGIWVSISAVVGGLWVSFQVVKRAEREGWLGRLLAAPITFALLACLGYSASEWWVAGPGRLPIWSLFFASGIVIGFLLTRRAT
jgi:hypothetical protein